MFKDIIIIEDKHKLIQQYNKKNRDYISETKLFNEPMDIQSIEKFEKKLEKQDIPYVLAEVSMRSDVEGKGKWIRGYCIFTDFGFDTTMLGDDKKDGSNLYKTLKNCGNTRKKVLKLIEQGDF